MNIKPIRTEADYRAAQKEIDELLHAEVGSPEADRLDLLSTLVEVYEERNFPIEPPTAINAILFRMEQLGLSRKDLEPFIGGSSRVSEILNGKRRLSLPMIRSLHEGLKIPLESLVREGIDPPVETPMSSPSTRKKSNKRTGDRQVTRRKSSRAITSEAVG